MFYDWITNVLLIAGLINKVMQKQFSNFTSDRDEFMGR